MEDPDKAWAAIRDDVDFARTAAAVSAKIFGGAAEPTMLGRFEVLGLAGEGAMGRVYVGLDRELGRKVAIKLIRQRPDDDRADERRARLLREAQAIARVQHPNVIAVHEVGRRDDDVFIVMEYVRGTNLTQWLARKPRAWPEVVGLFVGAGRGLAAAHAQQVVHRDFKPDNVLVSSDDRAIVVDFGLAQQPLDTISDADADFPMDKLTRTGAAVGTPAYMAPEQMAGVASDPRSDQFSFCVALFEALHGVRPFTAASWEETREKIRARKPPRPRRIPDWLHALLLRGLQYAPEDRYPSMDALLATLGRRRLSRRSAAALVLGALGLTAGGATVAGTLTSETPRCDQAGAKAATAWGPQQRAAIDDAFAARAEPYAPALATRVVARLDDYMAGWQSMYTEACEATHVRHEQSPALLDLRTACLDRRLEDVRATARLLSRPDTYDLQRAASIVASLRDLAPCANAQELLARTPLPPDDGRREALAKVEAQVAEANSLRYAGRHDDAWAVLEQADPQGIAPSYGPVHAELLFARGMTLVRRQDEAKERTLLDAVSVAEGAHHDHIAARCWKQLASHTRGTADAEERAASYLERFQAATARLGDPPDLKASVLRIRGLHASWAGKYDAAVVQLNAALALASAAASPKLHANIRVDLANARFAAATTRRRPRSSRRSTRSTSTSTGRSTLTVAAHSATGARRWSRWGTTRAPSRSCRKR